MTDEMLQTELWENRERRSLFLRVPFESSHLHQAFGSVSHPSGGAAACKSKRGFAEVNEGLRP